MPILVDLDFRSTWGIGVSVSIVIAFRVAMSNFIQTVIYQLLAIYNTDINAHYYYYSIRIEYR